MIDENLNQRFISFEGIDFSGKSTQINLLKTFLEEKEQTVHVLREPGGTEVSEKIRQILLDKANSTLCAQAEIMLFSAARAQLLNEKIIPLLKQNAWVLADRFVDSTTAYQGYGRNLELEAVNQVNQFATFGLLPKATFYLSLSAQEAHNRRVKNGLETDRLEEAGLVFFEKVVAGYEALCKSFPERFHKLDATQEIALIHRRIIDTI